MGLEVKVHRALLLGALFSAHALAPAQSVSASTHSWKASHQEGQELYPVVRLSLGESIAQVVEQSSYPLEPLGEEAPMAVTEPVVFEYAHPERGFVLPPTRFLWMSVWGGRVEGVKVSPHLEYLNLEDALSLAKKLIVLFDSSGWERVEKDFPSLEERRREFLDPRTRDTYGVEIQGWQNGGEQLYFNVERHWMADESLPQRSGRKEDLYLLNVHLDHLYDLESAKIEEFGTYRHLATELGASVARETSLGYVHNVIDMELVEATDEIPARVGTSFGIRVLLAGAREDERVPVRVRVLHPPTRNPETGRLSEEEEWRATLILGERRYVGWRFDQDWELVPGEWTIQIVHDEEVVVQKRFTVQVSH